MNRWIIWLSTIILSLLFSSSLYAQGDIRAKPGGTYRDPATGMEFRWVPGGSFQMGCVKGDAECFRNEKPVHTVRLDGFWLGKFEVTQGEWKRIMGNNPSQFKKGDNYPVEKVSWDDVQIFIGKLNSQGDGRYRLPSEAEWEYACRAGGKPVKYGTGSGTLNKSMAKYGGDSTVAVGSFAPNALGLHDMSGNVWEWVQDNLNKYNNVGTYNPIYESGVSGASRMRRGGSWYFVPPQHLRCSFRSYDAPSLRFAPMGFRLLRSR